MSTPYLIGTANALGGVSTTLVLAPATPSNANDVIHIAASTNSAAGTVTGITDTKGNTYVVINNDNTQVDTYEFETTGSTVGLTTGDTVTITYSSTAGAKEAVAIGIPGVTSGHDSTGTPTPVNGASATSSSITSGTLSQANEVVIAIVSTGNQAAGPTWGSGFTTLGSTRAGSNQWLSVAYKVVSSTSAVTATASWATSVKFCTLMTSFQIPAAPPPSGMYLVGQASAASGGTNTLSIPVTGSITQGDTITVGAVATAGTVTGVTDSAGNSYALVQSETVTTGCQLYTFESYNSDPPALSNSGTGQGRFGNTCDHRTYTSSYSATNASPCVFTNTEGFFSTVPANGTPIQLVGGTPPGGFTNGVTYFVVRTTQATHGITFSLAATAGGAPINSSSTGSGAQTFCMNGANTELLAAQYPDSIVGFSMGAGSAGCQKLYNNPGVFPTTFTSSNSQDYTALIGTGIKVWLCYKPAVNGTDSVPFSNSLSFWKGAIGASRIRVIMWQEYGGLSETDFINCYKNYASMIHGLGLKTVYDAAGSQSNRWVTSYPGDAYVDELALDYYGTAWAGQTHNGTTNLDPTKPIRDLADSASPKKPFGFGELGQGVTQNAGNFLSDTLFQQYMAYITSMMGTRLSQGLPNSDVMWYNGLHGQGGNTILAGDWRVPILTTMKTALTGATATPTITVTYSGTASQQAAIAIGDSNVQNVADKTVGNTATTGGTASVSTGTLSQSSEHIIAFVADLAAGGAPVLGDGLTAASTGVQAGAGPHLKAGFKAVGVTSSDTPSATFTSTTWAISAITHPLNAPVINNAPGTAFVSQPFSFTANASGGSGTLTWSETGTLPTGLTFTSAGVLSGTPSAAGTYNYTITVTDALGLSSSISVSQQVIPIGTSGGTTPAAPTMLPGNIISYADSDNEPGAGYSWTASLNATTPAPSTVTSVAGANSTAWQALVAGDTQIITGQYPLAGGKPYILSTFLFTNQNLIADVGVVWYDNTGTQIASVVQGTLASTVPGSWTPLTFATAAPGNAAFGALVITALGASAGQFFAADLSYLGQSQAQILVDWVNPSFDGGGSAGQLFMDVSPFVRLDLGVNYTRGRQDAISQVQAGSGSFQLQNDQGSFTRFSNTSIPSAIGGSVSLQRRVQLNFADEQGQWWTRFDGSIAQVDYAGDNTGNTSIATITLTDVLSALNRQDPLASWTKEQVMADNPTWHWSLDDPGNTGGTGVAGQGRYGAAAETSGSNGPPMRLVNTDSSNVATIQWQNTTGGIETLADAVGASHSDGSEFWSPGSNQPSSSLRGLDSGNIGPFTTPQGGVYFTPTITAQSAQNQFIGNNGYYLQAELPQTLATTDSTVGYAFECWFTMDPAISSGGNLSAHFGPYTVLSMGSSRQKACVVAGLFLNAGTLNFTAANYSQPPAFLGLNWAGSAPPAALASTTTAIGPDVIQRPHHLVMNVVGGSPGGVYVYLDGTLVGSFLLTLGQTIDTICVGAAYGGAGSHFGGIQLASVYPRALPPQQITMHCQLGQYGMWESTSDDALAQIASYANVPSFWQNVSAQHDGLTLMEYSDITGSNALSQMQLGMAAENGLLFVAANGALNFHTRDWRAGYGAPDLLLPPDTFDADMNYELVDQFMTNEMGVSSPGTQGAAGQQGTIIDPATGNIKQPTNVVASANTQASFINTASQAQYGIYASNSVNSPISLPLITWSRAFSQLGLASLSYWPDPNLTDLAAWSSNSRADPALFPAQLNIELSTLNPSDTITIIDSEGNVIEVPMGISHFYALEIDNMIAPTGTLPLSMPNITGSLEWFIEGISETFTLASRTMQIYVSPASVQRCWIPGDPVYGVLGSTSRIGISQSDLSTPQADGKDVAHDAGPPYWPPTFSPALNNPDGSGNGFVGAGEMRGISSSLQLALQPPMCIVSAVSQTQSFGTGALSNPAMNWDTVHVDTVGGMGLYPGWGNWYVCLVPGFYEISSSLVWAVTTAQAGYAGQGWIAIAKSAAQALAAGSGTPLTVGQYICPVGESVRFNGASVTPVSNGRTRVYLGLGDMVNLCGEHNFTSARGTSTGTVGSHMSIRFVGLATADDRTEINSALSNGGTVTLVTQPSPGSFVYPNTHTYSYQGKFGNNPYNRRNTDGNCFQGLKGNSNFEGSQTAQVVFNTSLIASQLAGKAIKSAKLTCTNLTSWYDTGTKLMLGYTTVTPGTNNFHQTATTTSNIMHEKFFTGQVATFAIPASMVQAIVTGGVTAFVLGDGVTTDLNYFGSWAGGPGNWTLTVNYQ